MNPLHKLFVAAILLVASATCAASFHLFRIEQLYSNADGTIQFVVLRESAGMNGENLLGGRELTSTHAGVSQVYRFPNDLPGGDGEYCTGYYCYANLSPTAHKRVLVASEGFAALGIVTPDYVMPNGFLPTSGGTLNYAGADQVTFSSLPTDGTNAIDRNGASLQNLATNFDGGSASVQAGASPSAGTLNFQGMWYASPAESEAGWGINFAHQGDAIFATWFTHDANRQAWFLTMSAFKTGPNTYAGDLIRTTGPPFSADPFDPLDVQVFRVGTGTLTFADDSHGTFSYTVDGASQAKAITRQVFGVAPTCTWNGPLALAATTNYQDIWWSLGGSESGWGINFAHQSDVIFATWFTYDASRNPLQMSATLFKTGPATYSGTLVRTSGPPFSADPWNPKEVIRTDVGTATVTFANGNRAAFTYTVALNGPMSAVTQTKQIERQVFRPPGTACK
jgi:hypothetical protein